jgi:hypothetical protein
VRGSGRDARVWGTIEGCRVLGFLGIYGLMKVLE